MQWMWSGILVELLSQKSNWKQLIYGQLGGHIEITTFCSKTESGYTFFKILFVFILFQTLGSKFWISNSAFFILLTLFKSLYNKPLNFQQLIFLYYLPFLNKIQFTSYLTSWHATKCKHTTSCLSHMINTN